MIDVARRRSSFDTLVSTALAANDTDGHRCFERREDAIAFVRDLIANDVLISTLVPPVTGETPLNHLLAELTRVERAADRRTLLADVTTELARMDEADVASTRPQYDCVHRKLVELCGDEVPVRFHVDLVKPAPNLTLGNNVVGALRRGIDVLHRIAPDVRDERLVRFATAFQDCYGDQELPLVEALDEERGIGFGERSADSIGLSTPISIRRAPNRDHFPPWTTRDQFRAIVLRWPRYSVEVAPRLTSAHNYYQRLPAVYQFLCTLQNDTTAQSRGWTWGALQARDFLPRVTYTRLVFARARWRVVPAEILPLVDIANIATRHDAVQRWRESRRMPQFVCLAEADRELLVDFDNPLSVESFLRSARRRSHSVFEHFPGADQAVVSDRTGRMAHEFITMWVSDPKTMPARPRATPEPTAVTVGATTAARYAPGTEWLYFKIYRGRADLDDVLLVARDAIVRPLVGSGEIVEWFFIRYADPHPHLRLRLRVSRPDTIMSCMSFVLTALSAQVASREIGRVQIDTYFPELNRYGGQPGMELAHRIFAADSTAALDALAVLGQRCRSWLRVGATFLSVDTLLDDWDLQPAEKARFVRSLRDSLLRVERVDRDGKLWLGRLFRMERDRVRSLLMGCDHEDVIVAVRDALSHRATIIKSVVVELRQLDAACLLNRTATDLLQAFVHLTTNRFLRNPRATHELVVYDLLCRAYAEILATVPPSGGAAVGATGKMCAE